MKPFVMTGAIVLGVALSASAQDAKSKKPVDEKDAKCKAMVKEKWSAQVPDLVKAADADKDGNLSEPEFGALSESAKKAKKDLEEACMKECGVEKKEKAAAEGNAKEGKPAKTAAKTPDPDKAAKKAEEIKKYDKNGDGKLDAEEKKAMKEAEEKEKLAAAFKKADANGDGKVSVDEAIADLTGGKKK